MKYAFGLMAMIMFFQKTTLAKIPVYSSDSLGVFFQKWLVCGPFPNPRMDSADTQQQRFPGFYTDYLSPQGGENNISVREEQPIEFEQKKNFWKMCLAENFLVNFETCLCKMNEVCAYAYGYIRSREEKVGLIALGSDDLIRLWVNGMEIWDRTQYHGVYPDQYLVPVKFKKGINPVLVKIGNRNWGWGFCFRLLPFDSQLFKPESIFKLSLGEKGDYSVQYQPCGELVPAGIRDCQFSLYNIYQKEKPLWRTIWNKEEKVFLPPILSKEKLNNLRLDIQCDYFNGISQVQTFPIPLQEENRFVLFENGQTQYKIWIDKNHASPTERAAAAELAKILTQISGADFRVDEKFQSIKNNEGGYIVVGYSPVLAEMKGGNAKPLQTEDEAFVIENVGANLWIWGGSQRGTMYGVYAFLEKYFGCRWYSPQVTLIPQRNEFKFSQIFHKEKPGIPFRNLMYFDANDTLWCMHNRINTTSWRRRWSGGVNSISGGHTFRRLCSAEQYFEQHPEYFSLRKGIRLKENSQLCLTNPDVLKIVVDSVRIWIKREPQARAYAVAQNDNINFCECHQCSSVAAREESQSGPLIRFVNQVAEAISHEFPEKKISTFAYQYSRKPPKFLKPRPNVAIRLCSIECCFAHAYNECPMNHEFLKDFMGWKAITDQIYIFDYVVNFTHLLAPYPNFNILQKNIKILYDHGVQEILEEGAFQSSGAEFATLRMYLLARLMWNPEADVNEIIDDFMTGYYGRGGLYVSRYFKELQNQVNARTHFGIYSQIWELPLDQDFLWKAEQEFEKAEVVAEDQNILARVRVARLPLYYYQIQQNPEQSRDEPLDQFIKITREEKIEYYKENGKTEDLIQNLKEIRKK